MQNGGEYTELDSECQLVKSCQDIHITLFYLFFLALIAFQTKGKITWTHTSQQHLSLAERVGAGVSAQVTEGAHSRVSPL